MKASQRSGVELIRGQRDFSQPLAYGFRRGELVAEERGDEGEVFLATGDELAHGEVVDFEAPAGRAARVLVADRDEAFAPAFGESVAVVSSTPCAE